MRRCTQILTYVILTHVHLIANCIKQCRVLVVFFRKKKRKVDYISALISYNDACLSLDLPSRLTCRTCDQKSCFLTKQGRQQKPNFRTTSKRNHIQQRYTDDYVNIINASPYRLKITTMPVSI